VLDAEDPQQLYLRFMSHWRHPALLVPGAAEPATVLANGHRPRLGGFVEEMMFADLVGYLPDDILVKVDRASMGVSLECRVPFLDHRVVEFVASLPMEIKTGGGQGKQLLRQLLARHVPSTLVDRPKWGFVLPLAEWLRGPLRDWAEDLLDDRRLRDRALLEPSPIRVRWQEHLAGRRDWSTSLWGVLMFQAWLQRD
jgi:asparagine synthase (glutamine-hydrolysing)